MAKARACQQDIRFIVASLVIAVVLFGCDTDGQSGDKSMPDMKTDMIAKVHMCASCHGSEGISSAEIFPNLAGQQKDYIAAQMTAFREHTRQDRDAKAYMWGMAAGLDDATIGELAAYFSAKTPAAGAADPDTDVTAGEAIYKQGAPDRGVPACGSCHGDKGEGNAIIPRLAGQHRDYLAVQLGAFSTGSRENATMNLIAKKMTHGEMKAVAAYLASL